MKKIFAKQILAIIGWKAEATQELLDCKKYMLIAGPHTSNWDFVIGKLTCLALGIEIKFLIKQELFFWPLGWLLRKMGAYPVNRSSPRAIVEFRKELKEKEEIILTITPEGTRDKTTDWKDGFYTIAKKANMKIFVGTLNYKDKVCRIGDPFEVTGNFEKDLEQIKKYYKPEYAKHEKMFAYHTPKE